MKSFHFSHFSFESECSALPTLQYLHRHSSGILADFYCEICADVNDTPGNWIKKSNCESRVYQSVFAEFAMKFATQ